MPLKLTKAKKKTLADMLAVINTATPYMMFTVAEMKDFASETPSLVLANTAITDGDKIAYALSEAGQALAREQAEKDAAAPARTPIDTSAISVMEVDDFELPEKTTRKRGSQYPFDTLARPTKGADGKVKHSGFFIPPTEARPEPWKTMAGTVVAQNRRNREARAKDANVEERQYAVTERVIQGVKGAFVARIA